MATGTESRLWEHPNHLRVEGAQSIASVHIPGFERDSGGWNDNPPSDFGNPKVEHQRVARNPGRRYPQQTEVLRQDSTQPSLFKGPTRR